MIKVEAIRDYQQAYWIVVKVGDKTSAEYGPMSEIEARAMIKGMKSFAAPHIVMFDEIW